MLDEFVIMPNHIHGIIMIVENPNVRMQPIAETQNFAFLPGYKNKFGPQSKNLSSIVRGFKIGVKKYATINNIDFKWQSGFYDHIIRNDHEFSRIQKYILENPLKYETERNNNSDMHMMQTYN